MATNVEKGVSADLAHALALLADWPIDPYGKLAEARELGAPQYTPNRSAAVSLAAARRYARSVLTRAGYAYAGGHNSPDAWMIQWVPA